MNEVAVRFVKKALFPFLRKGGNAKFIEKIGKSGVKIAKKLRLSFSQPLLSWKK